MTEPISDPAYWKERLRLARGPHPRYLFHSIFRCDPERWTRIEEKHRSILAAKIGPTDSVLDAGCGYGRLLNLMPVGWCGPYLGVDLSPDFIVIARERHPDRTFLVGDLRELFGPTSTAPTKLYDWAVLISVRPMVRRNEGEGDWDRMERNVRRVARKLLYLEYDPEAEGSVE